MSNTINFSTNILLIIESSKIDKNNITIKQLISKITDWNTFIELSYAHGVFPLVYNTLKTYTQEMPENILSIMKQHYMNIVKENMLMSAELIKVMHLLTEHNIKALSFKGPLLSQMAYGDVTLRQYVDLDILIQKKDINNVTNILKNNLYKSEYDLETYQNENLVSTVHDVAFYNIKNNVRLECHWSLTSGEFYIDIENWNLFEEILYEKLNNKPIPTMHIEKLIVYLCIHGYKHMWERVEWLADILHLNHTHTINWNEVLNLAYTINADRVVLSSLFLCEQLLDMKLDNDINKVIQKEKKLLKVSKKMLDKLPLTYAQLSDVSVHSKHISSIQLYMLKTFKNQFKYVHTLFKPTELDYQAIKLPKYLGFVYYVIRPFNILFKALNSHTT